ncbi:shikimate dehydrogenase [Candidatus Spongiihabitans sp.]|uniref:shikimate dehydrogenase n=1 Tax=Candidatus Spongiihabitans sp. TaxID=3101308 RepID=UPI003C7B6E21
MTDLFDFKLKSSGFAVMGNPVQHSKSPQIHRLFAQQCGIAIDYDRIQVDAGGFDQAISHFSAHGGAGLNITLPYKVKAWRFCQQGQNSLSHRASQAQAVNTLRFENQGGVFGDNTDGAGLVADLQNNIGFSIQDKSILVVGAGGAARGVIGSLLACCPLRITIANRTVDKATALSEQFGDDVQGVGLDRAADRSFDLIVNGTAASLAGQLPGIGGKCIAKNTLVYDLMYDAQPTIFMNWALAQGAAQAHDGLGMLVEQAAESFYVWHRRRPHSRPVIDALRRF